MTFTLWYKMPKWNSNSILYLALPLKFSLSIIAVNANKVWLCKISTCCSVRIPARWNIAGEHHSLAHVAWAGAARLSKRRTSKPLARTHAAQGTKKQKRTASPNIRTNQLNALSHANHRWPRHPWLTSRTRCSVTKIIYHDFTVLK